MASNYRSQKSIIGKMRRKYGLKDNVDLKKAEIAMTPDDWKIFSEALTFPNGKPSEKEDK